MQRVQVGLGNTMAAFVQAADAEARIGISGLCSDGQPMARLRIVRSGGRALGIEIQAAGVGGALGAARGGARVALQRQGGVARHAVAVLVADAEVVEAVGVAQRRGALVQPHGLGQVGRDARAFGVLERQVVQRRREAAVGGALVPQHGVVVARRRLAAQRVVVLPDPVAVARGAPVPRRHGARLRRRAVAKVVARAQQELADPVAGGGRGADVPERAAEQTRRAPRPARRALALLEAAGHVVLGHAVALPRRSLEHAERLLLVALASWSPLCVRSDVARPSPSARYTADTHTDAVFECQCKKKQCACLCVRRTDAVVIVVVVVVVGVVIVVVVVAAVAIIMTTNDGGYIQRHTGSPRIAGSSIGVAGGSSEQQDAGTGE
jgi:hypothetical protein